MAEVVLKIGHSRVGQWLKTFLGTTSPSDLKLSKYAQPTIELGQFLHSADTETLEYTLDAAAVGVCAATEVAGYGYLKENEVFEVHAIGFSGTMTIQRLYLRTALHNAGAPVDVPITTTNTLTQGAVAGVVLGQPLYISRGSVFSAYVSAGTPSVSGFYLIGRRLEKA